MGMLLDEVKRQMAKQEEMRKKYRYEVLYFPSMYGCPAYTNWWIVAWFMFLNRYIWNYEVRLKDNITGKEIVW